MIGVHVSSDVPVANSARPIGHGSRLVVPWFDGMAQVDEVKLVGANGISTKNATTRAEVKIRIVDSLWSELPMPPLTEPETSALADRIYDYVWARTTAEPPWMDA